MTGTRRFALIFGIVFLLAGVAGFIPGVTQPHTHPDVMVTAGLGLVLGLFPVNVLHNLAHLLFGAVLGAFPHYGLPALLLAFLARPGPPVIPHADPGCRAPGCGQCWARGGAAFECRWSCAPERYGSGGACDCGCGLDDPDCAGDLGCSAPGCAANGCASCFGAGGAEPRVAARMPARPG